MDYKDKYHITSACTALGSQFYNYPVRSDNPSPTLLLFVGSGVDTLEKKPHSAVGRLLHDRNWNVVSLDLPCHGADQRLDEPEKVTGWAQRIAAGEEITANFQLAVSDVIGHLIGSGIADPQRIAAAGVSYGAIMAFHAAAHNPAIRAVAGLSPVTDLLTLPEFSEIAESPIVQKLALAGLAPHFSERSAWICIGNADKRAGTDRAAAFAQALSEAGCRATYREMKTPGHIVLSDWHSDAALWLQTAVE